MGSSTTMRDTTLWLSDQGMTYRLVVSKLSNSPTNALLGEQELEVHFELSEASNCAAPVKIEHEVITFKLLTPFLMHDLVDDDTLGMIHNATERDGGIWHYQDAEADATCGDDQHPWTGEGYESNYDGGTFVGDPAAYPVVDPYCEGADCSTLKQPTTLDPGTEPEFRTMDVGDMLPYHWERTNRNKFFSRLAPNWTPGADVNELDFGIASYFRDVPTRTKGRRKRPRARQAGGNRSWSAPGAAIGVRRQPDRRSALVDWRCFYLGSDQAGGKCRTTATSRSDDGWDYIAPQCDLEWGCRQPFLIVIGDGENNCKR